MKQERIKKSDEENVKREVREWDKRRIWIGTPKKKKSEGRVHGEYNGNKILHGPPG